MTQRVKRTYNLSPGTVRRVRELASDEGVARSQDAVVELAVERLYSQMQELREAELWAAAAADPAFRSEMRQIATELRDDESWRR